MEQESENGTQVAGHDSLPVQYKESGSAIDKRPRIHTAANVNRSIHIGIIAIVLFFGVLGTWAAFAPLSGAVIGSGFLKPDTSRKSVQHLEGGIVSEILVRNGDHVSAGQTLIVIRDEGVWADLDMLTGQMDAMRIRAARLEAELAGADSISFPADIKYRSDDPEISHLLELEAMFFESRRRTFLEQIELLEQQALEAKVELKGLSDQVSATETALELIEEEVAATVELEKQKYVQKFELLRLKRGVEDYRIRLGEYVSEVSRTRQKIIDLNLRISRMKNEYLSVAAEQLTRVNTAIYDLEERTRPSLDAKQRQNILAPISGTVVDMNVFTVGGVIAPRERLMDIVQEEEKLIVETRIPLDSIDSITLGQVADVRLSAYSARSTPLVSGEVTYVSADSLTDERSGDSYYLVHVNLDPASVEAAGDQIELYPGMPAEVFINTGSRTALDYLLAPVTDNLRRSAREP